MKTQLDRDSEHIRRIESGIHLSDDVPHIHNYHARQRHQLVDYETKYIYSSEVSFVEILEYVSDQQFPKPNKSLSTDTKNKRFRQWTEKYACIFLVKLPVGRSCAPWNSNSRIQGRTSSPLSAAWFLSCLQEARRFPFNGGQIDNELISH